MERRRDESEREKGQESARLSPSRAKSAPDQQSRNRLGATGTTSILAQGCDNHFSSPSITGERWAMD
ncbi:hypothetical protein PRIPAC_94288 [Pristionchus pacificus]|uniref:Uncharacterized protein n=1 Tax=Pristionchus pacificus TaxID=54126 RepID=A0A2A6BQJ8_PRIPA|nr:hypothetical protein PRIPAC_94288 [Pristionchus pacificus]|eukprot:PDM68165.1 hypothetical protein PRIPAC_46209 [Pristionchus pacificus]